MARRACPGDPSVEGQPIRNLAAWEFAGLLVTYWCNAGCAFCYLRSGPQGQRWMTPEQAVRYWRQLHRVAQRVGKTIGIHISGGEPFGNWDNLLAIARAAHQAGLTAAGSFEKVETNAYWADCDAIVGERVKALDDCGMQMLVVSADVYHQQFVDFDRVRRCVEVARDVLGEGRVRVRWWDFYNRPIDVRRLSPAERDATFREALGRHRERLTGRAADELPQYLQRRPAETFAHEHCTRAVLGSRHVHVDPFGNVFPGVCTGIILGNAEAEPIEAMWQRLATSWRQDEILSDLIEGGACRLMQRARELGYQPLAQGYADRCHLCTHVREFLFERGEYPQRIGPAACYRPAGRPLDPAAPITAQESPAFPARR
jgi:organic radical activating enzyme